MKISLDFDKTYTLDPPFWDRFIELCHSRGHDVYCVTLRYRVEGQAVYATIGQLIGADRIVFAGRRAKADVCRENNIEIDVWIDDMPWFIAQDEKL